MLTDVATARDFAKDESQRLLAGYFGDTWGNLWRYSMNGGLQQVKSFGCSHPMHFSPTVAQLDRDDPTNHLREVYLVQATNSSLDLDTTGFAASKLVFTKEVAESDTNGVLSVRTDTTFGTNGSIELVTGNDSQICAKTQTSGGTTTCVLSMPTDARPTATPLGVLRKDASGFQVLTLWYQPHPNGCNKGATYLTVHEMVGSTVVQKQGVQVANEPVTSPVIMRGKVFVFGANGPLELTQLTGSAYVPGQAVAPTPYSAAFDRLSWTEVLEDRFAQ